MCSVKSNDCDIILEKRCILLITRKFENVTPPPVCTPIPLTSMIRSMILDQLHTISLSVSKESNSTQQSLVASLYYALQIDYIAVNCKWKSRNCTNFADGYHFACWSIGNFKYGIVWHNMSTKYKDICKFL